MSMLSRPRAEFTDDFYRFTYEDEAVVAVMERIAEKSGAGGGIVCELTVSSHAEDAPGNLYSGNFNLLTNNAQLARKLAARRDDVDWDGLLTQVAGAAKQRYREGEALVDLAGIEPPQGSRWLVPGLVEDTSRATLIAAAGGVGKSTIAVGVAITVSSGVPVLGLQPTRQCPVLYLDWEADAEIHAERAAALWRGAGRADSLPPSMLFYQRQVGSLAEGISAIRRRIADEGIGFVIIDSVGMARGAEPGDAEATIKMFKAMRRLGVPVLAIDHLSKEMITNPNERATAIGSIYTENSVCRVWVMRGQETLGGLQVMLADVKRNNTRQQPALSYTVTFHGGDDENGRPDAITYTPLHHREAPAELHQSRKWAMAAAIREGGGSPVPVRDLAEALGTSEGVVRKLMSRHDELFVRVGDGVALRSERGEG